MRVKVPLDCNGLCLHDFVSQVLQTSLVVPSLVVPELPSPVVPQVPLLSAVLPVMAAAILCAWAALTAKTPGEKVLSITLPSGAVSNATLYYIYVMS